MHVTTHEIKDWVWITFWWHDHAEFGEFGRDRPRALVQPWDHYVMDVTYDMELPWQSTGLPKAIFNPYLEGGLVNGNQSNCMACHQRAIWPIPTESFLTPDSKGAKLPMVNMVVTGRAASYNSYLPELNCGIHTSFLWTIPRLAGEPGNYSACRK
jgi:hypothetical protein